MSSLPGRVTLVAPTDNRSTPHAQPNYPAVAVMPGYPWAGPASHCGVHASENQLASAACAGAALYARAATGSLASDKAAGLAAAGLAGVGDDTAASILACNDCSARAGHALWVGYVVSRLPYCNIATNWRVESPLLSRNSPSEPGRGPARAVVARPSIERKKVVFMVNDTKNGVFVCLVDVSCLLGWEGSWVKLSVLETVC